MSHVAVTTGQHAWQHGMTSTADSPTAWRCIFPHPLTPVLLVGLWQWCLFPCKITKVIAESVTQWCWLGKRAPLNAGVAARDAAPRLVLGLLLGKADVSHYYLSIFRISGVANTAAC